LSNPCLYQLDRVTKSHGNAQRPVLQIDRLEVATGEVLCLVGPTGAGKSTLLRLLAAVEAPTSGQLRFGDYRLDAGLPLDVQRRITLVFQRPLLLTGTVHGNVEYGLRLRGLDRHSPRVPAILDRLGLNGLAGRSARTLSGGETQLVALARALVLEPEVLLLDEPTANLDPARVSLVEEVIGEVHRRKPMTVIWATHNLFQARRVGRRVALLLDGQLVEVADTKSFFESPRDPRTAAFVRGEMVY
jgi:tungstate transport system ATP-binding protein